MRWLIGIVGAVFLGSVAGGKGALVGFAVGFIIGVWLERKAKKHRAQRPPPLSDRQIVRAAPVSASKPLPAYRPPSAGSGISVRISFGADSSVESRKKRGDNKLTWHPPGQPVKHAGIL